jgi:prepilin signal peptidase PulO-like enzyme (type II secretory pathway)
MLHGHCRQCHSPISWQYPLVELAGAILTLATFWSSNRQIYNLQLTIYNLLVTYSLLAIFVSDLVYMTIPDEVVIFAAIISLFFLISQYPNILISNLFSALGAALFFYLLYKITKGKGMGFGDVKLALLIGLILGWPKIIVAVYLAFITGAVAGVMLILVKRKKFGQVIPFGPFLALSTWITILFGDTIWSAFGSFIRW